MNIKKTINFLVHSMGMSKIRCAEIMGTNVKMIDSITKSPDDTYMFVKAVRANTMSKGMKDSKGELHENSD
jgi:spore maturation protein CgeB